MVRAFRTAEGTVDASLIQSMWIALKAASRKFSAKTAISLNALNFSQTNNLYCIHVMQLVLFVGTKKSLKYKTNSGLFEPL